MQKIMRHSTSLSQVLAALWLWWVYIPKTQMRYCTHQPRAPSQFVQHTISGFQILWFWQMLTLMGISADKWDNVLTNHSCSISCLKGCDIIPAETKGLVYLIPTELCSADWTGVLVQKPIPLSKRKTHVRSTGPDCNKRLNSDLNRLTHLGVCWNERPRLEHLLNSGKYCSKYKMCL